MTRTLQVLETGPLATVQDLGRPGFGALGVGISGAADTCALRLANRLVGNPESLAGIEVTFGGLVLRAHGGVHVSITGAPCPVGVDGRQEAVNSVIWLPDGAELSLGVPPVGLRTYVAVAGGVDVSPVLDSRSRDTLAELGPDVLSPSMSLPVGTSPAPLPDVDIAPVRTPEAGEVTLRVVPGPRADWFTDAALEAMLSEPFEVTSESNRVGIRLRGPALERVRDGELSSEGMVAGALQVPPSGQPTLFLADHPVSGGYPVIAVVLSVDVSKAAQARPGQRIRFVRR